MFKQKYLIEWVSNVGWQVELTVEAPNMDAALRLAQEHIGGDPREVGIKRLTVEPLNV